MTLRKVAKALLLTFVIFTCGYAVGREVGVRHALDGVAGQDAKPAEAAGGPERRLVVRYFHSTKRCVTCNTIEAHARSALDKHFAGEMANGVVAWQTANMDEAWHADAVERYGLMRSSLVLVDMRGDEEEDYIVLKRVWDLTGDEQGFHDYVHGAARMVLDGWAEEDEPDEPDEAEEDEE